MLKTGAHLVSSRVRCPQNRMLARGKRFMSFLIDVSSRIRF